MLALGFVLGRAPAGPPCRCDELTRRLDAFNGRLEVLAERDRIQTGALEGVHRDLAAEHDLVEAIITQLRRR